MMWKLVRKTKNGFMYERHNDEFNYTHNLDICYKNTYTGYSGIMIYSYQKGINSDGFNNTVGLRRNDLLRLPFMILHFKIYRLFGKE